MTDRLGDIAVQVDDDNDEAPQIFNPDIPTENISEELEAFLREIAVINKAITKTVSISEEVEELSKAPPDQEQAEEMKKKLEEGTKKVTAIRNRLKRIADENRAFRSANPGASSEIHVRVNQHQASARAFIESAQNFENAKEAYKTYSQSLLVREIKELNPDVTDYEIQQAIQNGNVNQVMGQAMVMIDSEHAEAAMLVEEIKSRNNDLQKLEEDITQLHQLFVDMSLLVDKQGELLNQVEENVAETKAEVEVAHQYVTDARKSQLAARKKMLCIGIIIICILVAIIVPIVVTLTKP